MGKMENRVSFSAVLEKGYFSHTPPSPTQAERPGHSPPADKGKETGLATSRERAVETAWHSVASVLDKPPGWRGGLLQAPYPRPRSVSN